MQDNINHTNTFNLEHYSKTLWQAFNKMFIQHGCAWGACFSVYLKGPFAGPLRWARHVHLHWLISTHVADMWQIHRSINYKSKAAQNTVLTAFNTNACCFCTSANAKVFWVFFFIYITPFSISCMIWGECVLKESCYWSVETLHLCCGQWRVRSMVVVWQMLVVRSHLVCLVREKSRFPVTPCKLKPHQPCCSVFFMAFVSK